MPRNPLLFSMMERMDLVEKVGTGILRMKDAMKEYGLKEPMVKVIRYEKISWKSIK